jgi:tetratricopeptide (TPR) repeat protein
LAASCSLIESPEAAYGKARAAFFSGDLDGAIAYASAGEARWKRDARPRWFWEFRLLRAEALTAESRNKDAADLLNQPIPAGSQLEVRRLIDKAALLPRADAAKLLQEARAAVTDPELEIRIDLSEGIARLTDSDAGEPAFREALRLAQRERSVYWQSVALNNLSLSSKRLFRYEESIRLGLQALDGARKAGARRAAAWADGNLGSTYALLGDFDPAFEHQDKAVRVFEQIGARSNLAIALGELGLLYDLQGETGKASTTLQKAYRTARRSETLRTCLSL